jgi:hypothetical protein
VLGEREREAAGHGGDEREVNGADHGAAHGHTADFEGNFATCARSQTLPVTSALQSRLRMHWPSFVPIAGSSCVDVVLPSQPVDSWY